MAAAWQQCLRDAQQLRRCGRLENLSAVLAAARDGIETLRLEGKVPVAA